MNKKLYVVIIAAVIILNLAFLYSYHLAQKKILQKEKIDSAGWQKKYNSLLPKIEEYKTIIESLSGEMSLLEEKITRLQKEKGDLIQEAERLRSPEYLADIIRDRIRLKLEVKDLRDKIRAKDEAIVSLFKYKENLETVLGREKQLSQKLARSIAEERRKGYSLNREASQQSALSARLGTKVSALENSQLALRDKIKKLDAIVTEKNRKIKGLEGELRQAYGANKDIENKLAQAKEEKELLDEELAETRRGYEEIKNSKAVLENRLEDLNKEKEILSKSLLETSQKAIDLDEKLDNMELVLTDKELNIKELEEKYRMISQANKDLQEKAGVKERDSSFMVELTRTVTLPEAKGKILAASSKYNFVIINIGEEDGVEIGNRFSIYRGDGKIGEIEVTRIRPRSSLANIISLPEALSLTTADTVR